MAIASEGAWWTKEREGVGVAVGYGDEEGWSEVAEGSGDWPEKEAEEMIGDGGWRWVWCWRNREDEGGKEGVG
ncbi:hypothetical protein L1887_27393 [Cichorium endivia]|nr:hypothetical protein L1887_27393 [Cichorium endivia]